MQASEVTRDILEWAAQEIEVNADITTLNLKGTRHRVKLYPVIPKSAWQIDKSRKRKCPVCHQRTKIEDVPKEMAAFLFLPDMGQLRGECGCVAMPEEWAHWRRWKDALCIKKVKQ